MPYALYSGSLTSFRRTGAFCKVCHEELVANIADRLGDDSLVVCPKCRYFARMPTILYRGRLWFETDTAVETIHKTRMLVSLSAFMGITPEELERQQANSESVA